MLLQTVDDIFKHLVDQGREIVHLFDVPKSNMITLAKCMKAPDITSASILNFVKIAWLTITPKLVEAIKC